MSKARDRRKAARVEALLGGPEQRSPWVQKYDELRRQAVSEPAAEGEHYRTFLADFFEDPPRGLRADAAVADPYYAARPDRERDLEGYVRWMRRAVAALNEAVRGGPVFLWHEMEECLLWHRWAPPGTRIFSAAKGFVHRGPSPLRPSVYPVLYWGNSPRKFSAKEIADAQDKDFHYDPYAPCGAGVPEDEGTDVRHSVFQVSYIINACTARGMTVLDPCMGLGTVGVAALELGRHFVGLERCEDNLRISREKLAAARFLRPQKPGRR